MPESEPTSPVAAMARRRSSVRGPKKPTKSNSSILSRLEQAKERNLAARRIQRCWWRYVGGGGQQRRHNAAQVIQHAWGRYFVLANAKRELEFRRWMRSRRETLRRQWKRVTYLLTLRQRWAIATVQQFARCGLFRLRLVRARRYRCAVKILKWFRKCQFLRRYGEELQSQAVLLLETLRQEAMGRRSVLRQQRLDWYERCRQIQSMIDQVRQHDLIRFQQQHKQFGGPHRSSQKAAPQQHSTQTATAVTSQLSTNSIPDAAKRFCFALRSSLEERLQPSQPLVETDVIDLPRPCPPPASFLACGPRRPVSAAIAAPRPFTVRLPSARKRRPTS